MRRQLLSALAVSAAVVVLAGCGSDADPSGSPSGTPAGTVVEHSAAGPSDGSADTGSTDDSDSSMPSSAMGSDGSSAAATDEEAAAGSPAPESGTAGSGTATASDEGSSSNTGEMTEPAPASKSGDAGAAGSGAAIKAGASAKLPTAVGDWKKAAGSSGPGTIYNQDDESVIISFLSGSDYDGMVANIDQNKTKAGSGMCGSSRSADNLVCYLKAADGVLSLSASAGDTPLPDLVSFANELTSTLGTS